MRPVIPFTAALAVTANAAPLKRKPYIGTALVVHIHIPGVPAFQEPSPAELYKLANYHQAEYVTEIDFDHKQAYGIDINSIKCRAYSDALGTKPLGAFTNTVSLAFDPPTTVGSVICYAF